MTNHNDSNLSIHGAMKDKIYQIKISLKGFSPKIWRRILVHPDLFLPDFHKIIQTTMGWENYHLHQFIANGIEFTQKSEDDDWWDNVKSVDYENVKISDLLVEEKDKIIYEYDFGDGWEHDIVLEKILPVESGVKYPICIGGKNNCPPEDVGGVSGYAYMLEVLSNPKHEEYEMFIEWLGGPFDPEYFDKNEINELLQMENYGCFDF